MKKGERREATGSQKTGAKRMSRRVLVFTCLLTTALLSTVPFAEAQQAKKVHRIGRLIAGHGSWLMDDTFAQALRQLGWVEGRNIAFETRQAEVQLDRLPELAAELVRLKVDVIVGGGAAVHAAKQATKSVPIVFVMDGDPVEEGLVGSLARPGGNLTGLTLISPRLTAKRLEILKEALPKVRRVGVLWNPANPSSALEFREGESAARTQGLKLQSLPVRASGDFEGAFRAAARDRADALLIITDPVIDAHHFQILDFIISNRLPSMHGERTFVEAGGLISYGPSLVDLWQRAATYVDKILKGTRPADLPVEQPTKFELIINLKTAKQIGAAVSPEVLARAARVIK
jgi:putative ABC transport system substrate-binding protein